MAAYRLSERENNIMASVKEILLKNLSPKKIILFGSKAGDRAGKSSDFDIAVDAEKPSPQKLRAISNDIETASGLYKVDLVFLEDTEEEFKKIITETGKVIYEQ